MSSATSAERQPLLRRMSLSAQHSAASNWDDFKGFIRRGNVVDLAGHQLEVAFLILKPADMDSDLCRSDEWRDACRDPKTPEMAHKVGAVTWNYGHFAQSIVNFLLIALMLFFLIKAYTATTHRKSKFLKKIKECPYCLEDVSINALKCKFCGSELHRMEDLPPRVVGGGQQQQQQLSGARQRQGEVV
ncbi:hypothetical protein HK104_003666, partial [Borealophlyctis nickersoniae]